MTSRRGDGALPSLLEHVKKKEKKVRFFSAVNFLEMQGVIDMSKFSEVMLQILFKAANSEVPTSVFA